MHRIYHLLTTASIVAALTGCFSRDPLPLNDQPGVCGEVVKELPVGVNRNLDLLFVIDNSGSMAEEQEVLIANFSRFVSVLNSLEGGLPNLHIGIVSTDMGVGRFDAIQNCTDIGDQGLLQAIPRGDCEAPDGNFIRDIAGFDGLRDKNYSGSLADAFACIARLGVNGCGFEQPLAAMRRALDGSNPGNVGFLRASALLMVVFITDEDDCSVPSDDLFTTEPMSVLDPLGPLSSFRCFEFGVECAEPEPRAVGPKTDCRVREDSVLVNGINEYVTFLKTLKRDPSMVLVSGIFGTTGPVDVQYADSGEPFLKPSCQSASGTAVPAIRLQQFLDKFPQRGVSASICSEDQSDAFSIIAALQSTTLGAPCLEGNIDLDIDTDGVQYQCTAADVRFVGQEEQDEIEIPQCLTLPPEVDNLPCWRVVDDRDSCPDTASGLSVHIERGDFNPPPGAFVRVRCLEAVCNE